MRDEKRQIVDQEDVIVVGSDVTLGELLASESIRTQAKALADGIREDLRHGLAEKNGPIRQIFFQDISCGCRNRGQAPCQKDGGRGCHGVTGENHNLSIMGSIKVGTPSCQQACPVGVDIPAVLEHMRDGDRLKAQRTLMKYHPMAQAVCLLCGRCRSRCVRAVEDEGVAAEKIMYWLGADVGKHPEIFFIQPSGDSEKWIALEEITISGLAAAYYLRRMGNHIVFLQEKEPEEVLSPYGQALADAMKDSLKVYMNNLRYMGVVFEKQGMDKADRHCVFDQRLSLGPDRQGKGLWDLLEEICHGVKTANNINLDLGLKSYLEPMGPLGRFRFEGVEELPLEWETPVEDTGEEIVRKEASRCGTCGCFGVSESRTGAALFMLETEIHTSHRVIRAQDYFAHISPWEQLKPEEDIICLEIPKSGDFVSGCVFEQEITLAYAFLGTSGNLADLRMTFGGVAPVPIRLTEAEKRLRGKSLSALSAEGEALCIMDMLMPRIVLMKMNREKTERMQRLLARALEVCVHSAAQPGKHDLLEENM